MILADYRYVHKHRIPDKRRILTDDLILINSVWNKLESINDNHPKSRLKFWRGNARRKICQDVNWVKIIHSRNVQILPEVEYVARNFVNQLLRRRFRVNR